ncbi:MAG: glutamyl-tRNA reductase [Cardiobacteriaceae bacterium]|nr:glutamyl-tRNA reductase [Cardiobacteriaceae bacterium]
MIEQESQKSEQNIFCFGLNHKTASVEIREKLAFSAEQISELLLQLKNDFPTSEFLLLATCNRTEFYYSAREELNIAKWLENKNICAENILEKHTFSYTNREAVKHLYRVASGLDSLILGEPQILGQIKSSYQIAKKASSIGKILDHLFQQSFAIVKQIRTTTAIGESNVSVVAAAIKLTENFFDDFEYRSALIIGAGETGKLAVRYLKNLKLKRIIIANRSLEKAQSLAEEVGGFAISLGQVLEHINEADIIFGAAQLDSVILTAEDVQKSLNLRREKLQVLLDLAMPKIFDNNIERINNAFLYSIDDLGQIIEDNLENRRKAAEKAEFIINLLSNDFFDELNSQPQQQLISAIRKQAENIRKELLADFSRRLQQGEDADKLLEQLSYKLTNKLMHRPCELLKAIPPDHRDWLAIVEDVFLQK